MRKGQALVFILVGILILAGIIAAVFYLTERGSFPSLVPVLRPIKTVFFTKGSEEYCRQFGPGGCPSDCEVRSSCPICMDIGCYAKATPRPFPASTQVVVPTRAPSNQVCIQVITPAKDPRTDECREFPTPCDVPEGWEKVGSCGTQSDKIVL